MRYTRAQIEELAYGLACHSESAQMIRQLLGSIDTTARAVNEAVRLIESGNESDARELLVDL